MTIEIDVPGRDRIELAYLLLDANGTLTDRGDLVEGVAERLEAVAERLEVRILSADTFRTLDTVARSLEARSERVESGDDKARVLTELGSRRCVAIGNGANDARMLREAELGIVVVGPEGAAGAAVHAADVVCASILDALDLLLDQRALVATLRR